MLGIVVDVRFSRLKHPQQCLAYRRCSVFLEEVIGYAQPLFCPNEAFMVNVCVKQPTVMSFVVTYFLTA